MKFKNIAVTLLFAAGITVASMIIAKELLKEDEEDFEEEFETLKVDDISEEKFNDTNKSKVLSTEEFLKD